MFYTWRLRLHCSRERWRRDKVGLYPYERECLDWPQRQAQVTCVEIYVCALVSSLLRSSGVKTKWDFVLTRGSVWTQRYWLELPDKGSPNHLSEVAITRSSRDRTVSWQYRGLLTEAPSGDVLTRDHSEGRLESEYAFNGSCQDDHGSTSNVEREDSTLDRPLARSFIILQSINLKKIIWGREAEGWLST